MRWLAALVSCCSCAQVLAFGCTPVAGRWARASPEACARRCGVSYMQSGSNQDEIAELEARLEALKQAEAEAVVAKEAAPVEDMDGVEGAMTEMSGGFDVTTMSSRKKVASMQGPAPEELLSEAWKESEAGSGGIPIVQAAGAVAVAIGLVAFSQVPIGQETTDLSSFGGRTPTLETPTQIKARYETLGIYDGD